MNTPDTIVIIPAAGQGKRMGVGKNKLFLSLGNETILECTLRKFLIHPRIKSIYLAIAKEDEAEIRAMTQAMGEQIRLVYGGEERQDSVWNALQVIRKESLPTWILVHDGARPLFSHELIDQILEACETCSAAVPVIPLKDTIRRRIENKSEIVDRSMLFATQTPQGFRTELLLQANDQARKDGWKVTDDASLVEHLGHDVAMIPGEETNIKITTPLDWKWGTWLAGSTKDDARF
ncbi:MAG: 2-C-methyl-D-erythritol 4-phosphate cytidylyltransferase [SAR324 cluster bacterium]|nr:2-C-methyl-D-erythritol 4-phosphate cytidylyltransferase [SAR324 cluster bacterium]